MHRKMLRLFPDRVKQIDSRRRAGSLGRGPNYPTGSFLPMRAGKNEISREACPCARMPWFAEKMRRMIGSDPVHQRESNAAVRPSYRLASNTSRIILQEHLQPRVHL